MSKTIKLTDREADILDGLIGDEIDVTKEAKLSARTRITTPSSSDDMDDAMSEYDYFFNRLYELYALRGKICSEEENECQS